MELYILLIAIIIILLIIMVILTKKHNNMKSMLETLEKEYDEWSEEFRYSKREIERLKKQIDIYEQKEIDIPEIVINKKPIKKNHIYKGKRALVGDYVDISSENTMKMLQSFGITVDIVKSGEDIVDRIKNGYECDIIFTNNIYKQGYDGRETLNNLKNIEGFNIPVVIHTVSYNKRHTFVNEYGFDEYIEKPLDQEKLKPVLDKLLKNKKGDKNDDRKRNR